MNRKHLAIFATAGLIWSGSPVFAMDGISRLVATGSAKADAANDQALQSHAAPTDLSAARKKKGKSGPKGGERYMAYELENTMITSYRSPQGGRPKRPSGGDLLPYTGGSFAPNAPSATGTPLAPPASRGAGPVIR